MMMKFYSLLLIFTFLGCAASTADSVHEKEGDTAAISVEEQIEIPEPMYCNADVTVGAERLDEYVPLLEGKRVGIVGNQSSQVGTAHLVDTLLALDIAVEKVFSPEHGFRGKADAGEKVDSEIDQHTGLPIVSLYGKNKKPGKKQLEGLDILVFDIQDVGVRFYTYISTLHYVMEAAAENNIKVLVLDRPNPNGHYTDGPVLKKGFDSFVGMHQVPVVHGMTVGEYAQMINGEHWLANGVVCDLNVISCEGWDHTKFYELPIAPSPNLPNMTSVYLYPSLCFFEGTTVSIGRGTSTPFQIIGHPDYEHVPSDSNFTFVPAPNEGAKHPKLEGEMCKGVDLHEIDIKSFREEGALRLDYLLHFYSQMQQPNEFFLETNFINLLAGSDELKSQVMRGDEIQVIRSGWQKDLDAFNEMRKKYLLYPVE